MTAKTIDCNECGQPLPAGRLACPACGTLLASVAAPVLPPTRASRARRSEAAPAPVGAAVVSERVQPPKAVAPSTSAAAPIAPAPVPPGASADASPSTATQPSYLLDPVPVETVPAYLRRPAFEGTHEVGNADDVDPDGRPGADTEAADDTVELATNGYVGEDDLAAAHEPDATPWPPLREPVIVARPYGRDGSTGGAGLGGPLPGAYLPPNSMMPALAGAPGSVAAVAPAREPGDADQAAAAGSPAGARLADVLPGVAPGRMTEIAGWFVVVGSSMAVLGFLLPWSVMVIGARGSGSYLDDWGLASPTHTLIVVGLLAVLALGVLQTPVPAWLRTGVLGLGLGGLLVGLTWPYLFGPLGAGIGVLITSLGAVALLIGGGTACWATRHAEVEPAV